MVDLRTLRRRDGNAAKPDLLETLYDGYRRFGDDEIAICKQLALDLAFRLASRSEEFEKLERKLLEGGKLRLGGRGSEIVKRDPYRAIRERKNDEKNRKRLLRKEKKE